MSPRYKLGDTFNIAGYPTSEVIGIDDYKIVALSGKKDSWFSYTLLSHDADTPLRWWASDAERGLYCWSPAKPEEIKGQIDLDRSGLCILQASGNTIVTSPYSATVLYRDGNDIYCQEAFENEVLFMKANFVPSNP